MRELLEETLERRGFEVRCAASSEEGLRLLEADDLDAVVTDLKMAGMTGIELCERIATNRADVPVLVITAFGSMDTAIAALRAGAFDFITKPLEIEVLTLALQRAIQHRALRQEVKRLRKAVAAAERFDDIIGHSPPMEKMLDLLERAARSGASVVITGESGTGKELAARAIHKRSPRASGPFVAVDCASVPEQLLESELFGHRAGSFTDARSDHEGLFVRANGGTLFLDEIGEMPPSLQPKLLRALQERRVRPVGSTDEVPFDVRLVAATNRDLESDVDAGRFRRDLFFRINVIHIELPPLRTRGNDVLLLAQHLLEKSADRAQKDVQGFSPQAAEKLLAYDWPGNVRELQNCVERAIALTTYQEITVDDLPEKIRNYRRAQVLLAADDPADLVPMVEMERRYIMRVLEAVKGNRTLAAKLLGFDRKTLYRKLKQYNVETT